jgi:hypothetical protein
MRTIIVVSLLSTGLCLSGCAPLVATGLAVGATYQYDNGFYYDRHGVRHHCWRRNYNVCHVR